MAKKKTKPESAIRDRIKELRRVKASSIKPNPRNWREHPDAQRAAMSGVLAEIGYADALIARELEDGSLELIDGHLRRETTPNDDVPVLVLDVTEAEADKILLTLDPLAAMAKKNQDDLEALFEQVQSYGNIDWLEHFDFDLIKQAIVKEEGGSGGGLDQGEILETSIRYAQLVFQEEQFEEFRRMVFELGEKYGLSETPDIVMEALRRENDKIEKPARKRKGR